MCRVLQGVKSTIVEIIVDYPTSEAKCKLSVSTIVEIIVDYPTEYFLMRRRPSTIVEIIVDYPTVRSETPSIHLQ